MLHLPNFTEPALPDNEFVIEVPLFDKIFAQLLAQLVSLLFERCFDPHWLFLRDTDEIVDDGLVHEAFDYIILVR